LYLEDFKRLCAEIGFLDARMAQPPTPVPVAAKFANLLGNATFQSITFRLFKLPQTMETLCEDYGQVAKYKGTASAFSFFFFHAFVFFPLILLVLRFGCEPGTIPGHPHVYALDDHHRFETGRVSCGLLCLSLTLNANILPFFLLAKCSRCWFAATPLQWSATAGSRRTLW
jgi:arsenite methyltransferase